MTQQQIVESVRLLAAAKRKAAKLTIKELAKAANISCVAVSKLEQGGGTQMYTLASVFGVFGDQLTDDPEVIGSRLRSKRGSMCISQRELADRMDTLPEVVCEIENGHYAPRITTLAKFCEAMDLDIWEVLAE